MEVKHELKDELNGTITVALKTDDYKGQVEGVLKTYRKKANMPGFRPGHVPMSLVKKMYGTSAMAEEINKILSTELNKYITENNLQILGNPLPIADDSIKFDINALGDFDFNYEIGMAPEVNVELNDKLKFNRSEIEITDELLNNYKGDIARRYGKVSDVEKAAENDMLQGTFEQLDADGNVVEGGVTSEATISLEFLEDSKLVKKLMKLSVGDSIDLDPESVSKGHEDLAKMLNITHEEVHALEGTKFKYTVSKIFRIEPAAIDQQLFDTLFGKDAIKSEEELMEKLKADLEMNFNRDADRLLVKDVQETLIEKAGLNLPEDFLKRWMMMASEKPVTMDQVEADFENYTKSLRWSLIENKLVKDNNVEVTPEEAKAYTKELLKENFKRYGMNDVEDEMLESSANQALSNQEEAQQIYNNLYGDKLLNLYKNSCKIKDNKVSYDEFVKLATGKPAKKGGIMNNISNLFS